MLLCLSWTKAPTQSRHWKPGAGSVLIEDYNWVEMLCAFQSVTLFGETSVKSMYNENSFRNPICVAYRLGFFVVVNAGVYACVIMHSALMGRVRNSHGWT